MEKSNAAQRQGTLAMLLIFIIYVISVLRSMFSKENSSKRVYDANPYEH